jgi:glutamate 5-kinase
MTWQRVVIKIGTSSLTDERGRIFAPKMWAVARGAQVLQETLKCKVVLVSSGAGAAGRERLNLSLPLTLPEKQAAAAVGQTLLMLDWARALAPLPVAQILLTASDIQERERYVNAKNALEASLKLGAVPIINENDSVATSEIKLGDNDTLSAWVAYLVDADALIILTDVDGLYDSDPRSNPNAKRLSVVNDVREVEKMAGKAGSSRGTGGMVTKLRAAKIAAEAGIETLIIGGGGAGLEALARGTINGTRILAKGNLPTRKAWLSQQKPKGTITIDAGAFKALQNGRSLLPSGVTHIKGHFDFGDAIAITYQDTVIAHGLSNYSDEALGRIKGKKSSEIESILGYKDFDEVIHRDNLVVLQD